jgi:hypothetical protein
MSKDNSDYKKSLQHADHKVHVTDNTKPKVAPANVPGSREDSMRQQASSKKKNKK